jgi:6-phosphogluconolactonase
VDLDAMTTRTWLYVGCYTGADTTGIHVFDASGPHGRIEPRSQVGDIEHASFLAGDAARRVLYAVSETPDRGAVVAYRISPTDGSLSRLDQVSSHGSAPCHVSVDGHHVHVANYASGTIATHLSGDDGMFGPLVGHHQLRGSGPHPRQSGPHAHCIVASSDEASVYAADLGADVIARYVLERGGSGMRLADQTVMPPGSGPRHIAFHPEWPVAYVVCELDNSLAVLDVDPSGQLHRRVEVSTLPADHNGDSTAAAIVVHPDGRRLYVSNRGHDSIATFAVDRPEDTPILMEHVSSDGRTPRHLAIHPSGRSMLVANQDSDTLVAFTLDDDAIPRRAEVVARVSQPVCTTFVEVDR